MFSVLGFMAKELNVAVKDVVDTGNGVREIRTVLKAYYSGTCELKGTASWLKYRVFMIMAKSLF